MRIHARNYESELTPISKSFASAPTWRHVLLSAYFGLTMNAVEIEALDLPVTGRGIG